MGDCVVPVEQSAYSKGWLRCCRGKWEGQEKERNGKDEPYLIDPHDEGSV